MPKGGGEETKFDEFFAEMNRITLELCAKENIQRLCDYFEHEINMKDGKIVPVLIYGPTKNTC